MGRGKGPPLCRVYWVVGSDRLCAGCIGWWEGTAFMQGVLGGGRDRLWAGYN